MISSMIFQSKKKTLINLVLKLVCVSSLFVNYILTPYCSAKWTM